jgi:hypothetical protein
MYNVPWRQNKSNQIKYVQLELQLGFQYGTTKLITPGSTITHFNYDKTKFTTSNLYFQKAISLFLFAIHHFLSILQNA